MTAAEQWFYRGDALRLGNRKQFYGVCVKPKEFTKDQVRNKSKLSIGEKQDDPDYVLVVQLNRTSVYETEG
jgi:hypothetical protein